MPKPINKEYYEEKEEKEEEAKEKQETRLVIILKDKYPLKDNGKES